MRWRGQKPAIQAEELLAVISIIEVVGTSHHNAHGKRAANSHWAQPQPTASDSANRGAIRTEPMLQHATDTVSFFQAMAA